MTTTELTAITNNIKQIIADIDSELILESEEYNKYKGNYYSIEYQKQIDECIGIILNIEICNYDSADFISIWCDTCIIDTKQYYPIDTEYNELSANNTNYNKLANNIKETYNIVKSNCKRIYEEYIENEREYLKQIQNIKD